MGTIIKSVAFENFYNYYGSYEANEYQFKAGINIVNADNNMGKSKFYNGFMWMLRDQVYDSDIKAFVDANESLVKIASGKAKAEDHFFQGRFQSDIHKWRCGVLSREVFKFFNFRWRTASYAINDECF